MAVTLENIQKAGSMVGDVANMMGIGQGRQMKQSKKLMDIQKQNQMELNAQGQALAMKSWKETNYPAQVGMLKEAGMNPGLLYGQSGGSGATAQSGSGGSASGAQAPQARYMDLSNTMAMQQMQASIELMKAQANKANAEANVTGTTGVEEAQSRINKLIAETKNEAVKGELMKVQTGLTEIQSARTDEQITAQIDNLMAQTRESNMRRELTGAQFDDLVEEVKQTAIGRSIENRLLESKINLTEMERSKLVSDIMQRAQEIAQKQTGLEQGQATIDLRKWEAEMNARYPSIMNTAGGLIQGALNQLEAIGRYYNPKVFDYARRAPK